MRLIDADAAIKDAELNYAGVYDVALIKYFLDKQPTIKTEREIDGCEACINKYCLTCVYKMVDEYYEPCKSCDENHNNYRPSNYCPDCGKRLIKMG